MNTQETIAGNNWIFEFSFHNESAPSWIYDNWVKTSTKRVTTLGIGSIFTLGVGLILCILSIWIYFKGKEELSMYKNEKLLKKR